MYALLFSLVLTRLDPERAHHLAFTVIRLIPRLGMGRIVRRFTSSRSSHSVKTLGLDFATPFGLAAGFDKDARGIQGLGALGFGHVEVGTITASGL